MFDAIAAHELVEHHEGDIRDLARLREVMAAFKPTVVLHLAAQAIVRGSYDQPLETFSTNVIGTANVLECCRNLDGLRAVVICTSDKCYQNDDSGRRFSEMDPLGGRDPYSASKAAAEIVTAAYRDSFFPADRYEQHRVGVASVRAGNVIGGGDWAADRIVPDAARSFISRVPLVIRRPGARRPWQFVLEPLAGYLLLARALCEHGTRFNGAWNFGPTDESAWTVQELADRFRRAWGEDARVTRNTSWAGRHEADVLRLDSARAHSLLGWRPRLSVDQALEYAAEWYKAYSAGVPASEILKLTARQIAEYSAAPLTT